MLVFLIHGVATQDAGYGDQFKKKVKEILSKKNVDSPIFYSSFWGHAFKNKTDQLFNWVRADVKNLSDKCKDLKGRESSIYRYQEAREDFIAKFFGDFLTYLNSNTGASIREEILTQFQKFIKNHPEEKEVAIVSHSLGTLVLWDLLFAKDLPENDSGYEFRKFFNSSSSALKLRGVVTMGSPLLFMRLHQNIDFSAVDNFAEKSNKSLTWLNIIHASDLIAYPLGNAIKHDKANKFLFTDQFLWMHGNSAESGALRLGQVHAGMALGMADAHADYWSNDVVADLMASLVSTNLTTIATKRVHKRKKSYIEDLPKN